MLLGVDPPERSFIRLKIHCACTIEIFISKGGFIETSFIRFVSRGYSPADFRARLTGTGRAGSAVHGRILLQGPVGTVLRGIKTLAIRMEEHNRNALAIAHWRFQSRFRRKRLREVAKELISRNPGEVNDSLGGGSNP